LKKNDSDPVKRSKSCEYQVKDEKWDFGNSGIYSHTLFIQLLAIKTGRGGLKVKEFVYSFVCKFWVFQVACPVCPSENISSFGHFGKLNIS